MPHITGVIDQIDQTRSRLGITLYPPASHDAIVAFEQAMGLTLPNDFYTFYRFCDGLESDEDMFRMIPLEEILGNTADERLNTTFKGSFEFSEYMIYSDMWTVSISPTHADDYRIQDGTKEAVTLTQSLPEFLAVFLQGGVFEGLYAWRDRLGDGKPLAAPITPV